MSAVMDPIVAAADEEGFDPFAGGAIERIAPTTEAQREVWLGDRLSTEASLAFNESIVLRLRGVLDSRAMTLALDALVGRHESLRATISPDGMQMMIGEAAPMALSEHSLTHLSTPAQEQALAAECAAAVRERFLLEQGPLFRAALYKLSNVDHVLLLTAHHAICDGWSWGVIAEELGQLYAQQVGAGPALLPAPQYSEYAVWEAAEAASPEMNAHVGYWLGRFAGNSLPVLELPLDHRRPAVRTFTSKRIDQLIDQQLADALRKLSARSGRSLVATMFSGFATLLHRLTEQDDLVIGIAAAGQFASEMHGLVGHCVNLLPIRVSVDSQMPFEALATQSATALLDASEHQTLTYGTLLKKLPVPRDPSRLPLVSVMFNVDRAGAPAESPFPGLEVGLSTIGRAYENFELFLNVTPVPGGMQMEAQFNCDLFDDATIQRWLAMYEALLRSAVSDSSQTLAVMQALPAADAQALRALQPAPVAVPMPDRMHAAFAQQAQSTPTRVALRHGDKQLRYAELDEQSNQLARALRARGVQRGQLVGLCMNRGIDMVVAMLGVLKSGAAYVPLDPDFPKARLDYYAEDAKLALLLTESTIAAAPRQWCDDAATRLFEIDTDSAWRTGSAETLAPGPLDAQSNDPAYVIYTSGSTGKPKGVCVPHGAVANFLHSMKREPSITAEDKLAAVTTLSFDIAVLELMLPLTVGAETIVVPREAAMDGNVLAELLRASGATMMQATPGMWRLLVDANWQGPHGFRALVGGESLPADLAHELLRRCGEVWNMYGPTETTVWSTLWRVSAEGLADRSVSIGKPIDNTTVWILDAAGQPCPIGVPGEICIGGKGVTLGYLDRPELTADRFVVNALDGDGAVMYRTGDRGRWRNDGLLEHLGRFDFQVKVRGYRIELGEIEARCDEAAGVARSVVLAREDQPGDVRLVAYLAPATGASIDLAELDRNLRAKLPQYMVPQHVVVLPSIPLLPNGKVDRKALPAPVASKQPAAERLAPRNEREKLVLATMESVLNLPGLGIRDDFFALGGHSLLAARLTTLLSRQFDLAVPLRTLFESPTAERLAAAVDALANAGVTGRAPIVHKANRLSAPLTPMQERIRFIEELHPGRPVYNAPSGHRFGGALDVAKFEQAFREMVRRQPALRTAIGIDPQSGETSQLISDSVDFDFPVIDLTALPQAEREATLQTQMQAIADKALDIHRAPMFNVALFKLGADEHAFVFVPHHLVWDGWSFDLYQVELSTLYAALVEGKPHGLPELQATMGDYAEWYRQWLAQPEYRQQLDYWKNRFASVPAPKAPHTDLPRRAGQSGEGGTHWIKVDKALTESLREVARQHEVTLSMLTLGLYVLMMSSVIDTDSIVIATPVRGREAPEVENVMGFFNNVLPLPFSIDRSQGLGDFMKAVKQEQMAMMNYQQVPFERLANEAEFAQRGQGVGLYQALFSFQDARERPSTFAGLKHGQIHLLQRGATDDLGLWLMDKPNGLEGAVVYNADIYLRETGAAFKERYDELLAAVAANPDQTIDALLSAGDSASAAYLKRLGSIAPQAAVSATATEAKSTAPMELLLPEQAQLAQVWASALSIDVNDIRGGDNFFDLGGDSLLAMRVIQNAEKALGFTVDARRYVFESLSQLATAPAAGAAGTSAAQPQSSEPQQRTGLLGRVFGWGKKS